MVEFNFFKTIRCVTLTTLFSVPTLMDIVYFVAGKAKFLCFFIAITRVATGADRFLVFVYERKLGFLVLVAGIQPCFCGVTALTGLGELTQVFGLVGAFFFVAAIARTGRFAIFFPGFMAALTLDLLVLPLQLEISQLVIKGQLIQFNDISFSAPMVGMTNSAFL